MSRDDSADKASPGENEREEAKEPFAAVGVDSDWGVIEVNARRDGIDVRNPATVDTGLAPRLWLALLLPL